MTDALLPATLQDRAAALLDACRAKRITLATAESCTGGLIAAALTAIAGSSDVVECGFVTYSNAAKMRMLGVAPTLLASHGAVSEPVARAMAEGALAQSGAGRSIAVTGIAGPGGGSAEKPVGLVWFARAGAGMPTIAEHRILPGDRTDVREATVLHALAMLAAGLD
ncbi:MAG: CinA family protein [Rhodospirillales bacterium]|nr:CinA family protein [Rhodospirillales bacterium]